MLVTLLHKVATRINGIPMAGPFLRRTLGPRLNLGLRYRAKHPIDSEHNIDTGGYLPSRTLAPDEEWARKMNDYVGVQPSVVRQAIRALPDTRDFCFIDLGCGKGRANVVASEFPFKRIVGIELSHALAETARKNAEIIQKAKPARTRIEIIEGNAVEFPEIGKNVVVFLFNPFGEKLIGQLVGNLERRMGKGIEELFVIYHNPVWAEVLDTSSTLTRYYAFLPEYDPSEKAFSSPDPFPTVIWQGARALDRAPWPNAGRRVLRVGPQRAILGE
jgi:SAM-dependent methyltransferase